MKFEEIIKSQEKLLKKIKDKEEFTLIVIGKNGSGKTTLLNNIEKLYKNVGKYDVNGNRQFAPANPYNQEEYKKSIFSRLMSSGESLFEELSDNFNKDVIIFDEPTATLDLFKTSITIESFIRNRAKIRVLATNDYLTLKLLSGYTETAFNCEIGEMVNIKDFLNEMIEKTTNELINNSPFEAINFKTYEDLKIEED